jgi:NADH-quinone oxidoreductase subunit H
MNPAQIAYSAIGYAAVLSLLFFGTIFYLSLERLMHARSQHRDGPGRLGKADYFQVWKDFRKVQSKKEKAAAMSARFHLAFFVWKLLPAAFLLVLLGGLVPAPFSEAELPLLLLLPVLAASAEAIFIHGALGSNERFEWRRRLLLRIMGGSALFLSFLAVAMRVGEPSLGSITGAQSSFPYMIAFTSPGLFLCALAAFCAIFLFINEGPIEHHAELSLNRSTQYLIQFVNKMWVFCLISFWVFIFFGGANGILGGTIFLVKTAVALFLYVLLQASFPKMRSTDAGELTARWLLRLCLVGFFLEAVWVGVWV